MARVGTVLVAAGSSERVGAIFPKQFLPLGPDPMFFLALESVLPHSDEVAVVTLPDFVGTVRAILRAAGATPDLIFRNTHIVAITGGGTGLTYTPNPNFFGTDTFTYRASDGGLLSDVATVTLNVMAVNDIPLGVDDQYHALAGTPVNVAADQGVLVNDSDADARRLVKLIRGIPAKINLIPFNEWPGAPYERSDWERIESFANIIYKAGYASPIRTPV